jgi:hypothetical protein
MPGDDVFPIYCKRSVEFCRDKQDHVIRGSVIRTDGTETLSWISVTARWGCSEREIVVRQSLQMPVSVIFVAGVWLWQLPRLCNFLEFSCGWVYFAWVLSSPPESKRTTTRPGTARRYYKDICGCTSGSVLHIWRHFIFMRFHWHLDLK